MFKDRPLLDFCFSHITPPDKTDTVYVIEDINWFLAALIGFVLAVITCLPIKLIINCRRNRPKRKSQTLGDNKGYQELENRGAAAAAGAV